MDTKREKEKQIMREREREKIAENQRKRKERQIARWSTLMFICCTEIYCITRSTAVLSLFHAHCCYHSSILIICSLCLKELAVEEKEEEPVKRARQDSGTETHIRTFEMCLCIIALICPAFPCVTPSESVTEEEEEGKEENKEEDGDAESSKEKAVSQSQSCLIIHSLTHSLRHSHMHTIVRSI